MNESNVGGYSNFLAHWDKEKIETTKVTPPINYLHILVDWALKIIISLYFLNRHQSPQLNIRYRLYWMEDLAYFYTSHSNSGIIRMTTKMDPKR